MAIWGTNPAQAIAAGQAAQQAAQQARARRTPVERAGPPRRDEDEVIVGAENAGAADRVRSLSGNDQEQAREDHQQSGGYSRDGFAKPKKGRLDVAG